ncbi:unnamed protein product [Trichogramma brassicae]|uniref:DDE-1 domain-containing protein n=1 Tax=Trichogramma brassicae TaxID=86971 RepID=A0A6H5ILG7_9HYME|nr:unnamed protein product [Trichogramma brassicae]
MPNRTWLAKEEKRAPGFKVAKDRFTLLFCANATGDFKCKPMLVYRSETPRVLKGKNKDHLPVYWKSNKTAWVTQVNFEHSCVQVLIHGALGKSLYVQCSLERNCTAAATAVDQQRRVSRRLYRRAATSYSRRWALDHKSIQRDSSSGRPIKEPINNINCHGLKPQTAYSVPCTVFTPGSSSLFRPPS